MGTESSGEEGEKVRKASGEEREGLRRRRVHDGAMCEGRRSGLLSESVDNSFLGFLFFSLIVEQTKEAFRNLEEENETLKAQFKQCSTQLDSYLSQQSASQKVIQELSNEVSRQKPRRGEKLEPGSLT